MTVRTRLFAVIAALVAVVLVAGVLLATQRSNGPGSHRAAEPAGERADGDADADGGEEAGEEGEDGDSAEERAHERHNAAGEVGEESEEMRTAMSLFRDQRGLGLLKDPGAYTDAFAHLAQMPIAGAAWQEVTTKPYNSDAPAYRDPVSSNSGGGGGYVTGRIVGLAVDPAKHGLPYQPVYAAGAQGGVFRSLDNGLTWKPISDQILTLATGDLRVAPDGSLWYGTGEPNYGDELGSGVYRLANPWNASAVFKPEDRVGGEELEAHWIGKLAFDSTYAYAATSRGVYRRPLSNNTVAWQRVLAPVQPQSSVTQNIANDIVVQPGTGYLVANLAYRSTLDYNGFYISRDQGTTWTKAKPQGAINPKEVGPSDMAYSADGKRLYVVMESTVGFDTKNSALAGVYVSKNGNPDGPWAQIADASKLSNSGSALKTPGDHSYPVGVQAWYNRFVGVDPADHDHVYVGLEEVFESRDAGTSWNTIGRYWNFGFACQPTNTCDGNVLHSDQHSIAFGNGYVYAGNDGGLYMRKVDGSQSKWTSLSKTGQLRTLQYYGIGVGALSAANGGGTAVWGGMQDNGVSLLRPADNGEQVSPMGGDGGMMLVDPANGCRAVGEYTDLAIQLTNNCGQSPPDSPTIQQIAPADPNPQFIAPFAADDTAAYRDKFWIAGGAYVWENTKTWDSTTADKGWTKAYDLTSGNPAASATAVASQTHEVAGKAVHVEYAAWCGSCSSTAYNSGIATNEGGTWHQLPMTYLKDGVATRMPQRYISSVTIDPADTSGRTVYVVYNGFSAHYIEGFGAGFGHVYKSTDGGQTFVDVSGASAAKDSLPDVPSSDLAIGPDGSLYVATDLGTFVHPATSAAGHWERLGTTLPTTISADLKVFTGDGGTWLYDGTFGRGIWKVKLG
jgi:hypothetical protein